jgi:Ion channel
MTSRRAEAAGEATFRYGAVFLLVFAAAVFIIVSSDADWSRALAFAIVAAALLVGVGTAREPSAIRRRRAVFGSGAALLVTVGIAFGVVSRDLTFLLTALLTLAIPVSLARGLLRLIRAQGVTVQAVAGALAIYLAVGLAFSSAIGFVAAVGPAHFYSQGTNGTASDDVYYSFTVLTTTGFGDLTAAQRVGRALAVIEMLVGQLYLVTVIGILIGRRVGSAR